ncbi:MAG TPA: transcription termination factor NusA [Patescibacteria group bacterium]
MSKKSPIYEAIKLICDEKGLSMETVVETIESALAAAYRKDFGEPNQNIKVKFDPETGQSEVFDVKTVVADMTEEEIEAQRELTAEELEEQGIKRYNPKTDLMISEAKNIKKDAELEEEIITKLEVPADYGRMAAQTAKQVITQKLREAERKTIFEEFKEKEGELIVGVVQRQEGRVFLVDLGRAIGVLPPDQQVHSERYKSGQRIKVYVLSVEMGGKGPEITLSRAHEDIVKKLFGLEIPEIASGAIEIMSVAREAGSRTKISVRAVEENIDPIGSCVGQRGTRVQTIISELGGEKIDIIEYDGDSAAYITNALSPAKVIDLDINDQEKLAVVTVAEDQLSLAIGKAGQNVRLAAKLTGWKINIKAEEGEKVISSEDEESQQPAVNSQQEEKQEKAPEEEKKKEPTDPDVKN